MDNLFSQSDGHSGALNSEPMGNLCPANRYSPWAVGAGKIVAGAVGDEL